MKRRLKLSTILSSCLLVILTAASAFASLTHTITSATDVPVTSSSYTANGPLNLTLGFTPPPGANLTIVRNTGPAFITGTFTDVPQGGTVILTYNGVTYQYIANYYGGNGRSLVLQWPLTKISSWGSNQYRQLGNGGVRDQSTPVNVRTDGVLSGKTVTKIASGSNHVLTLTSDGKIFGWGDGNSSRLANGSSGTINVPVVVDNTGVLAGKTIVDLTANRDFSAALDSTGKAYTWGGFNSYGELGIGSYNQSPIPAAVDTSGVLSGKSLTMLSAGSTHMVALSSEGKVYSWGSNIYGELGNGSTAKSTVPVEVISNGALSGKTISAVAAGSYFSLALSTDGQVFAWGYGGFGQLGNGNYTNVSSPFAVDMTGDLAGKTVVAIAAKGNYGLALTSEGKVYGWGNGYSGNFTSSLTPAAVDPSGAISGKTIVAISSAMALASDGTVFEWSSTGPTVVSGLAGTVQAVANGDNHRLALMDLGPPVVARHPTSVTAAEGAAVSFTAVAGNQFPASVRWQASPTGAGGPFIDIVGNPTASTPSLTFGNVTNSQNGYAYRAVFSNQSGSTTTSSAVLSLVDWHVTYTSASQIPFQNQGFVASGPLNLQLDFAPVPGANLMVLRNTGTSFIAGEFSNLPHGSTVPITFNGTTYHYIANYYGGNGRSLVLQWPLTRLAAWGENRSGELGDGTTIQRVQPVKVISSGSLAGKTVVKVSANNQISMALTSEGRLYVWGKSDNGVLGNGNTLTDLWTPFELTAAGPLAGKNIISMSAGTSFCLALTREGQVYAWGANQKGQLGVGSDGNYIATPVALDGPGLFGGKPVVAVSAGSEHSLALTADGRVYAWGYNYDGRTGLGTSSGNCLIPTEIATMEDLGDRPIVAIAAGTFHSLVLAADGSLFAWGSKDPIGNNGIFVFGSTTPTPVDTSSVLAGKSVSDLAASQHNLVLASNDVLSSWGYNGYGQLGTGDTTTRLAPALVDTSGSLAGKTVTSAACGNLHSLVTTSDGKCYAWGFNDRGQLGNNGITNSSLPTEVTGIGAFSQMTIMSAAAGGSHSLAILDQGPPAIDLQPANLTATAGASVTFKAAASDPFGYHVQWQMSTTGAGGPFTDITNNPTATTGSFNLPSVSALDHNKLYRAVFSTNSGSVTTRSVTLRIVDWTATLNAPEVPAFEADGAVASGTMNLNLGFAPLPGTTLTLVKNTGLSFITGAFDNIPQGGRVTLTYNGTPFDFIANYYGGSNGRSLVLQWPWTRLAAWGLNSSGQLADGSLVSRSSPVISNGAEFAGKCILSVSAGNNHSLALTADGKLKGWGSNSYGQTGSGGSPAGPLVGKSVVSVSAGNTHSLAVCSDGTAYAWGQNFVGMLGDGSNVVSSSVPVPVFMDGVLAGRSLTAVAAGGLHSLALSSDGKVFSWGYNSSGRLGNGSSDSTSTPVAVDDTGILAGKDITAIAAGNAHSIALSTDGKVYAWGSNSNGELGDSSTSSRSTPVWVSTDGVLSGKTVVGIAAGDNHNLALTSDGQVFAWGDNSYGQLGNGITTDSPIPVAVTITPELTGKTIIAVAAAGNHSMALTYDGLVFVWGRNSSGQLGNGTTTNSSIPVPAGTAGILSGLNVMALDGGGSHSMAVYPADGLPVLLQQPASQTLMYAPPSSTTVDLTAQVVDVFPLSIQWQESVNGASGPFADLLENPTAHSETLTLENFPASKNGYAYRAIISNNIGTVTTDPATVAVTPVGAALHFPNQSDIPVSTSANNIQPRGALSITLGFAPTPGTDLTVIENTGLTFIHGSFDNLAQGSTLPLTFGGVTHQFKVDYFGGNGRSLVLHWAKTRITSWGDGNLGQLGNVSTLSRIPVSVNSIGVLSGQTVVRTSSGASHNLALTSNGFLAAWGYNSFGQLGTGNTTTSISPTSVSSTGLLAGKRVVGMATGDSHSLALTSEGKAYAWGANGSGRLGNGSTTNSTIPVAVDLTGALAGRSLVAIAAGGSHSLALASDGKVTAWGSNFAGQLGNNTLSTSSLPVNVIHNGALLGRSVTAIAAGTSHSLALTTDGRVFAWGSNVNGSLGTPVAPSFSSSPVAAGTDGLIAGKTVTAIAAGADHSLALTSDGMVYAWGLGTSGQLGNATTSSSSNPVAVATSGALAGKTVVRIAAGGNHSLAVTSDGLVFTWGLNSSGQLGNNSISNSSSPVAVTTATGSIGARMSSAISGGSLHSLAICGLGTACVVETPPSSLTIAANGSATFNAAATAYPAPTVRWQQSATGPTGTFSNISGNATATTNTLELTNIPFSQNGYAYRAVFTNMEGSANSPAATLTVVPPPTLTVPANITQGATGATGCAVVFSVTASDNLDGLLVPACNPPSGSTFPIGTTTVNCSVTNSLGTTATASFTVTVQKSYAWFIELYNLTDSAPNSDPNHTGVDNLTAYAFGIDPAAPDRSQLPSVQVENGHLQITYIRRKSVSDLTYLVEIGDDLADWKSGAAYSQQVSVTAVDADRESVVTQALTPVSGAPHRFMRIRIVK